LKKVIIPITAVSIIFVAFILLSVYTYSTYAPANTNQMVGQNSNPISKTIENVTKIYGCTKFELTQSIHCDPLLNRLVSYVIPSTSSLTYTNSGEPTYVGGNNSRAGISLDAKRMEAIEIPNKSSKLDSDKVSVSFWIKNAKNDPQPYGVVVSHTDRKGTAGWSIDAHAPESSSASPMKQFVAFSVFNQLGQQFTSPAASISSDGKFTHIVATFDGSFVRIYRNGNLVGSTEFKGQYTSNLGLPMTIGSSSFCLTCNWWSGVIEDLRFYNKSINENEVRRIFSNDSSGIEPNSLVGHWTFDGNLNDISGNNNNGILNSLITSIAFAPDGRLFFTEKNTGKIKIIKDDRVLPTPFATISDTYVNWEQGLLGLTIDPKFAQNHFVYLYYTSIDQKTGQISNRVVRFTDNNNQATDMVVLIDKIPASMGYHSGGALAFGVDDRLYIGVGDATEHEFAQDPGILTGKVLRINRDGTIPDDNPYRNSPVYTIGHRNIYGIAFDSKNKQGIIAEDGDFHYDKINLIQKGGNYGFPTLLPPNVAPELFTNNSAIKPLISYWQTITPTQAIYYTGDKILQLKDKFLIGAYRGDIYALTMDSKGKQFIEQERIALKHYPFEPVTTIAQSPSGDIYYAGYHIYKLDSLTMHDKIQELFPIEINLPSNISIKDVQASNITGKNVIDISAFPNKSQNNSSSRVLSKPLPLFLQINIPRAVIGDVAAVTRSIIPTNASRQTPATSAVRFAIDDNSSSSDNMINVALKSGENYPQLLSVTGRSTVNSVDNLKTIVGNTKAAENQVVTKKNGTSNSVLVSIVRYAADPSTTEPYNPSSVNIHIGTTVKWINNDSVPHTVTEGTPAGDSSSRTKFDSGIFGPGQTFEHTFNQTGIINYYCSIHPFMSGEVIVR
jgi:glucose/arabinose dehydrogenase/plastocyanin